VNAQSGDASVTGNTAAGDAQSGDATASVNIANISNSTFSLSDWLGVLFINVFGTWNGSFGVDTAAGEHAPQNKSSKVSNKSGAGSKAPSPKVFRFAPNGQGGQTLSSVDINNAASRAAVSQAVKAATQKM